MNRLLFVLFLSFCISCNPKTKENEPAKVEYIWLNQNSDSGSNIIWISSGDDAGKLDFISTTEDEFKSKNRNTTMSALLSQETDSTFSFVINDSIWNFKKEPNIGYGEVRANTNWSEYIGYFPDLKMQAVRSCSVSGDLHTFANIFMIHENTGKIYYLASEADYCSGTPVFSPNRKYMIFEDNMWDENGGYLNYFKIFKVKEGENFDLQLSYVSNYFEYAVDSLFWTSDNEIIIKTHAEGSPDNVEYLFNKIIVPTNL